MKRVAYVPDIPDWYPHTVDHIGPHASSPAGPHSRLALDHFTPLGARVRCSPASNPVRMTADELRAAAALLSLTADLIDHLTDTYEPTETP